MSSNSIPKHSLVLYKNKPAIVESIADKIEITLPDKSSKRVRPKDILMLHPGPVKSADLTAEEIDLQEAWDLLDGESCSLQELTELAAGDYTPENSWSVWNSVAEGLLFEGDPGDLAPRSLQSIEQDKLKLEQKANQEAAEKAFYDNIKNATLTDDDRKRLQEVEMVALGLRDKSQILVALDIKQTAEAAHRFLIECGYWTAEFNPLPGRNAVELQQPEVPVAQLPDEERLDLTHLQAWAIDDAGSSDPDDAISLDGDRIWVHIADVAALVEHDSEMDLEARKRAANLYLPEKVVHMLPTEITDQLGLGLLETSPALSIGFRLNDDNQLTDIEITPSLLKVTRISYDDADTQMDTTFADLDAVCERFYKHRCSNNAAKIDLPEASVKVDQQGRVVIKPLARIRSRMMVTDAMLMAGCAIARFCADHDIPIPFATQPEPAEISYPETPSEMFAYRRKFKASRTSLDESPHFGLGLACYTRVTSPLRRYMDLIIHQQLRLFISGKALLSREDLETKLLAVDQQSGALRRTERQSNHHWKLVYLKQNSHWVGDAIIVNIDERKTDVIIPELAMEVKIRTRENFALDDTIRLKCTGIDLPEQEAFFSLAG